MAREPELSIKVKVDPQIKPAELKRSIERQVKNSEQIPEIEIKPNKEKLVQNITDALKNSEVPITPRIDSAKLRSDIQTELDKIKNLPKVQIQVNVDDFSNELNRKIKEELKNVNSQLSYHLKNLTSNRNALAEVSSNFFGGNQIPTKSKVPTSETSLIKKETAESLKGLDQLISRTRGLKGVGIDSAESLLNLLDKVSVSIRELYNGIDTGGLDQFRKNVQEIKSDVNDLEVGLSTVYDRITSSEVLGKLGWNQSDVNDKLDMVHQLIDGLIDLPSSAEVGQIGELDRDFADFFDNIGENATSASEKFVDARTQLESFIKLASNIDFNSSSIKEPTIKTNYDKKLEKTNQNNNSGYFDTEHIQNYANVYDRAMSTLAGWQLKINEYKKEALQLEDRLVIKTNINSNLLKKQASDLKALLDGLDDAKLNKAVTNISKDSNRSTQQNTNADNHTVNLKGKVIIASEDIDVPQTPVQLHGKINISKEDINIPDAPIEIKAKIDGIENIIPTNTTTSASPTADNAKSEKIKLVKAATYNTSIEAMNRYIQKMGDIGVSQELLIQWTDNLTRQLQEQKSVFKEVAEYAEKYIKAIELQNRKQGSKAGSDINGVVGVGQITSASKQIGKLSTAVNNTENKELVAEFDTLQKSFNDFVSSGDRSLNTFSNIESAIGSLQQKVTDFKKAQNDLEKNTTKVTEKTITSFNTMIKQVDSSMWSLKKRNKTDLPEYQEISTLSERLHSLQSLMSENIGADENEIIQKWVDNYPDLVGKIKKLSEAYDSLRQAATKAGISINDISNKAVQQNALTQAQTRIANLQSQLHDYLEKFPKIEQSILGNSVKKLKQALNDPSAYQNADKLGQELAILKKNAKELGLESENLIDKFEKLFGTHFSTMITMAALHQMQNAMRQIYQNVVEIDSAMTELRKVTNLTASGYEEFMDRAADQAKRLGISISDFINSTADWARLGYDEQDAEELARVSSLLKNVGDGIESASDASSYLISGMQGFGLAADQASEFLDVLNQIANTEPVTANDLGVIIQKSAAAMNAAGNTYQETMAMAAAVNGVLQDDDISGTYLKTLSMYLRAAKTDAENAGIEIDGMASSVSELRSELKQLTGVDIMSDAAGKNFKSTYQIMKELSKVWGSLSDVTQANVTELISGKRGGQATSALLNNFSVAEDAMKQAANATGSALAENAKYLDSIQGRLAQLDTSFQSLSTHVLDSGIVKYAVSFLTTIIKITDNITKLSGALPPIAAAVSGILSVMQINGKLENGAGKVNMPAYARCA